MTGTTRLSGASARLAISVVAACTTATTRCGTGTEQIASAAAASTITCGGPEAACDLPLAAWTPYADGDSAWWADVDIRNMLRIFHPAVVSKAGRGAGARISLQVPSTWATPVLRMYTTDNYFAPYGGGDAQSYAQDFIGHRFRQVVVGEGTPSERVLWEQDVAGADQQPHPPPVSVDLRDYKGQQIGLTVRMYDKVASTDPLPGDHRYHGETPRFHTLGFFADLALLDAASSAAYAFQARPHESAVVARHQARLQQGPIVPRGTGDTPEHSFPVTLQAPATVPARFPIVATLPFPPGAVRGEPPPIRLVDGDGHDWPIEVSQIGSWPAPDGGAPYVRFARVLAVTPAPVAPGTVLTVKYDRGTPPAPQGISVTQDPAGFHLDNSLLKVDAGTDPGVLLGSVSVPGGTPLLAGLRLTGQALVGGAATAITATVSSRTLLDSGLRSLPPAAAAAEVVLGVEGRLDAGALHLGRFTYRVHVYSGSRSLRTELMTTSEPATPPQIRRLSFTASSPTSTAFAGVLPDQGITSTTGSLFATQADRDVFTTAVDGAAGPGGGHLAGWIATTSAAGEVQASTWRFWEQSPQSLSAAGGALTIGLFDAPASAPAYAPQPGEGKRHDVTLSFSPLGSNLAERGARGLLADEPPYLMNRTWFARAGAIAVVDDDWGASQPALAGWVSKSYGDVSPSSAYPTLVQGFGPRFFGDYRMSYGWANGYWATVQGPLHWALGYGDLRWLQREVDSARHIGEVGTLRLPATDPGWSQWDGANPVCQPDDEATRTATPNNENNATWPAFQVGESLVLNHWMTGDPESRSAALANADRLIRLNYPGLGSDRIRNQARPTMTLLRAWEMTMDPRYRDAAAHYLASFGPQAGSESDWRRGGHVLTYPNYTVISSGLDSLYAMNAYEYYRHTGDLHAAQVVVAIADAVYAEAMPAYPKHPESLGDIVFYVRYPRSSYYFAEIAILFHEAYDLTLDQRFLDAGRAAADRYTRFCATRPNVQCQPWWNFGWLDPELGGWLKEIPSPASGVTGPTAFPDPTNLCACSPNATCEYESNSRCACKPGFVGDGITCRKILPTGAMTAAASSQMDQYSGPDRAVDGNTSGGWSGHGSSYPGNTVYLSGAEASPWWQVDLGAAAALDGISIFNRTDCCPDRLDDYYVCWSAAPFPSLADTDIAAYASGNGSTCRHVTTLHTGASPPDNVHIGMQAGPLRYVRVQLARNGTAARYLQLGEVRLEACTDDWCP